MQGPPRATGMDPYQQQDFASDSRQATLSSAPSKNEQFAIQPVYLPPQSNTKFNSSQPYQQNVAGQTGGAKRLREQSGSDYAGGAGPSSAGGAKMQSIPVIKKGRIQYQNSQQKLSSLHDNPSSSNQELTQKGGAFNELDMKRGSHQTPSEINRATGFQSPSGNNYSQNLPSITPSKSAAKGNVVNDRYSYFGTEGKNKE